MGRMAPRSGSEGCAARRRPHAVLRPQPGRLALVGPVVRWVITAVGVAVVLIVLRDIFHTLWHPSGRGGFARQVMAAGWRAGRPRRGRHRVSVLAGPLAMVFVVCTWVA